MQLSKKIFLIALPLTFILHSQISHATEIEISFPLHKACLVLDFTKAKELIEGKADVNSVDEYGNTALHWASYNGSVPIVRELINGKADVNFPNYVGKTPLIKAWGRSVRLLLDAKARISDVDNRGNTALHWASYNGSVPIVRELINSKADVNFSNNFGRTPLIEARDGSVGLLLEAKARISDVDNRGNTALHWASYHDKVSKVRLLLAAKANILATTQTGEIALHIAASEGNTKIVRQLLREFAKLQRLHSRPTKIPRT